MKAKFCFLCVQFFFSFCAMIFCTCPVDVVCRYEETSVSIMQLRMAASWRNIRWFRRIFLWRFFYFWFLTRKLGFYCIFGKNFWCFFFYFCHFFHFFFGWRLFFGVRLYFFFTSIGVKTLNLSLFGGKLWFFCNFLIKTLTFFSFFQVKTLNFQIFWLFLGETLIFCYFFFVGKL